jgi:membrane-bound lytic murein transglycosylase MltF
MLNIRINVTINVKKVLATMGVYLVALSHLMAPAHAETVQFKAQFVPEKSVTVHLAALNVTTTRTSAINAINSDYAKYFNAEALAFLTVYAKGHTLREWSCLQNLWNKESHFNPKAKNMHSGAYGIAQFLPSTWGNYKVAKTPEAKLQIKYGLRYIEKRYGDAKNPSGVCNAWNFWQKNNWY